MVRPFTASAWAYAGEVPLGRVVTYGQVANEVGGTPRSVGTAMKRAERDNPRVPWWRVVSAGGFISGDAPSNQAALLREEGVVVSDDDRVDLNKHQWTG